MPPVNPLDTSWSSKIPDTEWGVYKPAIERARALGIPFALGGAFALAAYTGSWRNTKDLDFYTLPKEKDRFARELLALGMTDYFDELPYDRDWIFRGIKDGTIVDIIFSFANGLTHVDEEWISRAPQVSLRDEVVGIIPVEELIWAKIYVFQRGRCDWPDIFNLLYAQGGSLDWNHLLQRMGEDRLLLTSLLSLFHWLCPGKARQFPAWIWNEVGVRPPSLASNGAGEKLANVDHINLLESRPWFSALKVDNQ